MKAISYWFEGTTPAIDPAHDQLSTSVQYRILSISRSFLKAKVLLGDKGYDADWFRDALASRNIKACIPSKSNRKVQIPHDTVLYKQRHKVENMFGKLQDWRRIHTRYDRCAHTFMSAICIAATVIF